MKNYTKFIVLVALFMTACSNTTKLPLDYAGNIHFDKIERIDNDVFIDIRLTDGAWYKQPGMVLKRVDAKVKGNSIWLIAIAGKRKDEEGDKHLSQQIKLKKLPQGTYYIYYKNPRAILNSLKKITI